MTKSKYTYEIEGNVVKIIDQYNPSYPTMSVTNDAENVLTEINRIEDIQGLKITLSMIFINMDYIANVILILLFLTFWIGHDKHRLIKLLTFNGETKNHRWQSVYLWFYIFLGVGSIIMVIIEIFNKTIF